MENPNRLAEEVLDAVLAAAHDNNEARLSHMGIERRQFALIQRLNELPRELSIRLLKSSCTIKINPSFWQEVKHLATLDQDVYAAIYYLRLGAPRGMLLNFGFTRRTYDLARQICEHLSIYSHSTRGRLGTPRQRVLQNVQQHPPTTMDDCARLSTAMNVSLREVWTAIRHTGETNHSSKSAMNR